MRARVYLPLTAPGVRPAFGLRRVPANPNPGTSVVTPRFRVFALLLPLPKARWRVRVHVPSFLALGSASGGMWMPGPSLFGDGLKRHDLVPGIVSRPHWWGQVQNLTRLPVHEPYF